jgi:hypothetical protein
MTSDCIMLVIVYVVVWVSLIVIFGQLAIESDEEKNRERQLTATNHCHRLDSKGCAARAWSSNVQ